MTTDPAPPRNPRLLRLTSAWAFAAITWSIVTSLVALNTHELLRWLLTPGNARYVIIGSVALMLLWSGVRSLVGERTARVFLAVVATFFGLFGALLVFALKVVPFVTVFALALFSLGAMTLFGTVSPFNLRKPRHALEIFRQVAELTLAGATLGPELGWVETALVLLGLAAALVMVGDDSQTLADESRVVTDADMQRVATTRAVDMYLSLFRLTLIFTQLVMPRRKPKPKS